MDGGLSTLELCEWRHGGGFTRTNTLCGFHPCLEPSEPHSLLLAADSGTMHVIPSFLIKDSLMLGAEGISRCG